LAQLPQTTLALTLLYPPDLALGDQSFTADEGPDVAGNPRVSAPLAVTLVAPPQNPPTLTGLSPDTDTGVQGDDMTTDTTVGITGTGIPTTLIQLYNGLTIIGSATADDEGAFTITTPILAPGVYSFTATGTDQFWRRLSCIRPAEHHHQPTPSSLDKSLLKYRHGRSRVFYHLRKSCGCCRDWPSRFTNRFIPGRSQHR
jgi:hypothetical protein